MRRMNRPAGSHAHADAAADNHHGHNKQDRYVQVRVDAMVRLRRRLVQRHARSPHEQALRVHAVGCAGQQGHVILAGRDAVMPDVVGVDGPGRVDLVCEGLAQHVDVEVVALFQFIEPSEQHRRGDAAMRREHAVRALPADRQTCAVQVADATAQHRARGAVAYGQIDANLRDLDVAHHAVDGKLPHVVPVFFGRVIAQNAGGRGLAFQQSPVVCLRPFDHVAFLFGLDAALRIVVLIDLLDLGAGREMLRDEGIEQQAHAQYDHQHGHAGLQMAVRLSMPISG